MSNSLTIGGLTAALLLSYGDGHAQAARHSPRAQVTTLVGQVVRSDYEGDRAALERLSVKLFPLAGDDSLGTRALYWRGFALWRRAINGANEGVEADDMRRDLERAVTSFETALAKDTAFVDAKIAAASCLLFLVFLDQADSIRVGTLVPRAVRWLQQAKAADSENPRLLWVSGGNEWYRAAGRDSAQRLVFVTYERGLKSARARRMASTDPIEPQWGEPELLMSMAWSHLNRLVPDFDAAELRAREALALVPNWHYVRDILIPQIALAREKQRSLLMPQAPETGQSRR